MHAHWIIFVERFNYVFKYKNGQQNKGVDALSRQTTLLVALHSKLVGFDIFKDYYTNDEDFAFIWVAC